MTNKLANTIQQQAEAIRGALNIPIGSVEAENISKTVANLATSIQSANYSSCAVSGSQIATITASNAKGRIKFGVIRNNQVINTIGRCVQSQANVVSARNDLENTIEQIAKAKQKGLEEILSGLLAPIIIVLVIIALIIGAVIFLPKLLKGSGDKGSTTTSTTKNGITTTVTKPNRSIFAIIGGVIGAILGILILYWMISYFRNRGLRTKEDRTIKPIQAYPRLLPPKDCKSCRGYRGVKEDRDLSSPRAQTTLKRRRVRANS